MLPSEYKLKDAQGAMDRMVRYVWPHVGKANQHTAQEVESALDGVLKKLEDFRSTLREESGYKGNHD